MQHLDLFSLNFDLVAQLVEHLPFKERVLGSSPSQVTSECKTHHQWWVFLLGRSRKLAFELRDYKKTAQAGGLCAFCIWTLGRLGQANTVSQPQQLSEA